MLPDPLHPAVVHFPIVLTFLLPLAAMGALWHARRNPGSRGAWMLTVALAGALTASAWLAVETGEGDEEGAEQVVPEAALESHEEAAERYPGSILLLDHPTEGGGRGRAWDWSEAGVLIEHGYDVILAGGLDAETVQQAIESVLGFLAALLVFGIGALL